MAIETMQQSGIAYSAEAQSAAPETVPAEPFPDTDDPHVVRGYNRISEEYAFGSILNAVYPHVADVPAVQAEVALDIRRAGDVKTVASIVHDEKKIGAVAARFFHELQEKLPTGAIDLPMSHEEKTGMVMAVLMSEADELTGAGGHDAEETRLLKAQNEELLQIVTPDQAIMHATITEQQEMIHEQNERIAALERQLAHANAQRDAERQKVADRDRVIYGKTVEGARAQILRVRQAGNAFLSTIRLG